jgi:hypothetical protein
MNFKKLTPVIAVLFIYHLIAFSQCSDAGLCIIGKRTNEHFGKYSSSVLFGYKIGTGGKPDKIKYADIYAEANLQVAKFTNITLSVPVNFNSGPLGKASGMGDLTVLGTFLIPIKGKSAITVSLGGKFATGRVNAGDLLPQYYQPGLGTNDLLIGVGFLNRSMYANIAYQKPFGRSSNIINRLKRGDDILLRAGFFRQVGDLIFEAEILAVKRLQKSSVLIYGSSPESFTEIDNTNQLQINLVGYMTLMMTKQIDFTGYAALPLLKRDTNLDGLERAISGGFSFAYHFKL